MEPIEPLPAGERLGWWLDDSADARPSGLTPHPQPFPDGEGGNMRPDLIMTYVPIDVVRWS